MVLGWYSDHEIFFLQALWMALMVLSSVAKRRRKRRSIVGARSHQVRSFQLMKEEQRIMDGIRAGQDNNLM